jgi:hypothetical protein
VADRESLATDTVPAPAGYRSSACRIPFQRLPDTVPAPAGYRSSACRTFKKTQFFYFKINYLLQYSIFANPFLILS